VLVKHRTRFAVDSVREGRGGGAQLDLPPSLVHAQHAAHLRGILAHGAAVTGLVPRSAPLLPPLFTPPHAVGPGRLNRRVELVGAHLTPIRLASCVPARDEDLKLQLPLYTLVTAGELCQALCGPGGQAGQQACGACTQLREQLVSAPFSAPADHCTSLCPWQRQHLAVEKWAAQVEGTIAALRQQVDVATGAPP
jgi:hypothetical protein